MAFDFSTCEWRLDELARYPSGAERGRAMEELVAEMLAEVPGITVAARNALTVSGDAELDLTLVNSGPEDGLERFGYDVLVECKSQDGPLDSRSVAWFATQLRRRDVPVGLLMTLNGVTGSGTFRAAGREIQQSSIERQRIVVVVGDELRRLRSAQHLVALLERKRQQLVARQAVHIADAQEMRRLDPSRSGLRGSFGSNAIRDAIRESRREALHEILDQVGDGAEGHAARVEVARERLVGVSEEAAAHGDPGYDPLWLRARSALLAAGVAIAELYRPPPRTGEERRTVRFQVETSAPDRLNARVGGELWELLTDYYLSRVEQVDEAYLDLDVASLLRLCVDEMNAIDDIDPADAYDQDDR